MHNAIGKKVSQQASSDLFFQTYHRLLKQKERIDREISKLQGKILKAISRNQGVTPQRKVTYVPRLNNTQTLAEAIRECMTPHEEMTMSDILESLSKNDLYKTKSKYLYTMINNKLNRDKQIKKISRGVFIYCPRKKTRKRSTG